MSRINRLFGVQLALRRFFEARTIEALAEILDTSLLNAEDAKGVDIEGNEDREIIEL
jgi:hypothetical protein